MKFRFALVSLALVLGGCASTPPQKPISVASDLLVSKSTKIAIAMTPMPKVDTQFPGAGCLLCIAAASLTNSSLTGYVQKLPTEDLAQLPADIAKALRANGMEVTIIKEPLDLKALSDAAVSKPDFARKDFSAFKTKYAVDKLLVVDIQFLGVSRNYANYVPAGAPTAVLGGSGYLVNLSTNALEWLAPINIDKSVEGAWDEAPKYPGLTNAYFQAIEAGRDSFIQPFVR